jgi:hypothetical protein
MDKSDVRYGYARNNYPAPPITIEVNDGVVTSFSIEESAIRGYTSTEISALFEAAGVGPALLTIPIPDSYMKLPLRMFRYVLIPGKYKVKHHWNRIHLPESAFRFYLED